MWTGTHSGLCARVWTGTVEFGQALVRVFRVCFRVWTGTDATSGSKWGRHGIRRPRHVGALEFGQALTRLGGSNLDRHGSGPRLEFGQALTKPGGSNLDRHGSGPRVWTGTGPGLDRHPRVWTGTCPGLDRHGTRSPDAASGPNLDRHGWLECRQARFERAAGGSKWDRHGTRRPRHVGANWG